LVVKIAADRNNGEAGKSLFIGREKEINEIIEDVKSNKGTRLLLVGESCKSTLLDELYRRLTQGEESERKLNVCINGGIFANPLTLFLLPVQGSNTFL
jgi:hypothetical protein